RLGQSWNSYESLFECAPQPSRCRTGTAPPPPEREWRAGAPAVSPGDARTGALAREIKTPAAAGVRETSEEVLDRPGAGEDFRQSQDVGDEQHHENQQQCADDAVAAGGQASSAHRSEEHTSELQSRGHLVCRLLLEKKKKPASLVEGPPPHSPIIFPP